MTARRLRTSCKPCRKARIGCDAVLQKGSPCSNCIRRGKACDAQDLVEVWPNAHRRTASGGVRFFAAESRQHASFDASPSPSVSVFDAESVATRRQQALVLNDLLWDIYNSTFEARFAIWFGDSCCPYLTLASGTKVSASGLVVELDALECDAKQAKTLTLPSQTMSRRADNDRLLNDALRNAIYAYSARWLPLRNAIESSCGDLGKARKQEQVLRDHLWHRARRSICAALSRPSYRSILALFLFSLTEMPLVNDDPGSGQLCTQVLLTHFGILRSPLRWRAVRPLAYTTSMLPVVRDNVHDFTTDREVPNNGQGTQQMRDAMFWIGVVCDTSRSLVNQVPMVLLGDSGDAKVWEFILQRTVIFDQSFQRLHDSRDPLPDDVIVVILEHATACKTMYLGILNQFCDDLLHNECDAIQKGAERILLECCRFRDVFEKLLSMVGQQYLTLSAESQLNYVLLITHYNLGSLVLADVLDTVELVPEPLSNPVFSRQRACQAIVNVLTLALNSDRYSHDASSFGSTLLRDPTPEYMVEVFSRCGRAIFLCEENHEIPPYTAQVMLSVICTSLNVLSHISQTAAFVLSSFRNIADAAKLKIKCDEFEGFSNGSEEQLSILATCETAFIDEFLREMQIQARLGPSHRTGAAWKDGQAVVNEKAMLEYTHSLST